MPLSNTTVPLRKIRRRANPRTYRNPGEFGELCASVRLHGVIQPILVRPIPLDGEWEFEEFAGEGRYLAALQEHGPDYEMPVFIKDVDDDTADTLSGVENVQRADMPPADEAVWAAGLVGRAKGDRDEAARIAGWSRSKLDKRLALMNCSAGVREALTHEQIQLGHAELLATLAKDKQDLLLPIIISEKKAVSELKKTIEAAACSLEAAIFDKGECAACPHNSSLQTEMFGEAIATGNCTNRACYNEKSERQLEAIAYGMRDEYPIVRIIRSGDNHTRIQLKVDGPTGVGEEQAKACHACQNFGAAVSGLPDSMGKVYSGQCFDTACNQKMVAARIKSERDALKAGAAGSDKGEASKPAAGKTSPEASTPAEKAVTVISESEKVKQYRTALWRKALRKEVAQNAEQANAYLLAIALNGLSRNIAGDVMAKFFEKLTEQKASSSLQGCLTAVHATDTGLRQQLTIGLTVAAIDGLDVENLRALSKYHKLDLRKHWNLQKAQDFLEMLTKSEMKVLADELGIRSALGDGFNKLFAKSKPEVVAGLMAVPDFDYSGKVPKVLGY
ncbi:PRTRC genetic system ParB family protein [Cupriavidus gilardii J11]|uniref:PRTRC genetic system ParB family protein n=1 Tax=Cupriavidus gilardii J11 TaxID=936133 RepID=A0A562BRP1_9BURK|nr:PRTRC system ParB family protein [Cupriavidus gilardii]TWG87887.1 PRTRC genetic system ParB family protein [Cupriavidus gilardii J11]